MALSQKRTCLAVLRQLTNLNAAAFGELAGRSVDWMKKAESGKIPVPIDVARLIAHETGVLLDWLLAGDPRSPCLDWKGDPYSLDTWHKYRTKLTSERPDQLSWCNPGAFLPMVFSIAQAAAEKYQLELFSRDLSAALGKLGARYGQNHEGGSRCLTHMAEHAPAFNLAVSEKRAGDETDALMEFSDLAPKALRDSIGSGWLLTGRLSMVEPGHKEKIKIKYTRDGVPIDLSMMRKTATKDRNGTKKRRRGKSEV